MEGHRKTQFRNRWARPFSKVGAIDGAGKLGGGGRGGDCADTRTHSIRGLLKGSTGGCGLCDLVRDWVDGLVISLGAAIINMFSVGRLTLPLPARKRATTIVFWGLLGLVLFFALLSVIGVGRHSAASFAALFQQDPIVSLAPFSELDDASTDALLVDVGPAGCGPTQWLQRAVEHTAQRSAASDGDDAVGGAPSPRSSHRFAAIMDSPSADPLLRWLVGVRRRGAGYKGRIVLLPAHQQDWEECRAMLDALQRLYIMDEGEASPIAPTAAIKRVQGRMRRLAKKKGSPFATALESWAVQKDRSSGASFAEVDKKSPLFLHAQLAYLRDADVELLLGGGEEAGGMIDAVDLRTAWLGPLLGLIELPSSAFPFRSLAVGSAHEPSFAVYHAAQHYLEGVAVAHHNRIQRLRSAGNAQNLIRVPANEDTSSSLDAEYESDVDSDDVLGVVRQDQIRKRTVPPKGRATAAATSAAASSAAIVHGAKYRRVAIVRPSDVLWCRSPFRFIPLPSKVGGGGDQAQVGGTSSEAVYAMRVNRRDEEGGGHHAAGPVFYSVGNASSLPGGARRSAFTDSFIGGSFAAVRRLVEMVVQAHVSLTLQPADDDAVLSRLPFTASMLLSLDLPPPVGMLALGRGEDGAEGDSDSALSPLFPLPDAAQAYFRAYLKPLQPSQRFAAANCQYRPATASPMGASMSMLEGVGELFGHDVCTAAASKGDGMGDEEGLALSIVSGMAHCTVGLAAPRDVIVREEEAAAIANMKRIRRGNKSGGGRNRTSSSSSTHKTAGSGVVYRRRFADSGLPIETDGGFCSPVAASFTSSSSAPSSSSSFAEVPSNIHRRLQLHTVASKAFTEAVDTAVLSKAFGRVRREFSVGQRVYGGDDNVDAGDNVGGGDGAAAAIADAESEGERRVAICTHYHPNHDCVLDLYPLMTDGERRLRYERAQRRVAMIQSRIGGGGGSSNSNRKKKSQRFDDDLWDEAAVARRQHGDDAKAKLAVHFSRRYGDERAVTRGLCPDGTLAVTVNAMGLSDDDATPTALLLLNVRRLVESFLRHAPFGCATLILFVDGDAGGGHAATATASDKEDGSSSRSFFFSLLGLEHASTIMVEVEVIRRNYSPANASSSSSPPKRRRARSDDEGEGGGDGYMHLRDAQSPYTPRRLLAAVEAEQRALDKQQGKWGNGASTNTAAAATSFAPHVFEEVMMLWLRTNNDRFTYVMSNVDARGGFVFLSDPLARLVRDLRAAGVARDPHAAGEHDPHRNDNHLLLAMASEEGENGARHVAEEQSATAVSDHLPLTLDGAGDHVDVASQEDGEVAPPTDHGSKGAEAPHHQQIKKQREEEQRLKQLALSPADKALLDALGPHGFIPANFVAAVRMGSADVPLGGGGTTTSSSSRRAQWRDVASLVGGDQQPQQQQEGEGGAGGGTPSAAYGYYHRLTSKGAYTNGRPFAFLPYEGREEGGASSLASPSSPSSSTVPLVGTPIALMHYYRFHVAMLLVSSRDYVAKVGQQQEQGGARRRRRGGKGPLPHRPLLPICGGVPSSSPSSTLTPHCASSSSSLSPYHTMLFVYGGLQMAQFPHKVLVYGGAVEGMGMGAAEKGGVVGGGGSSSGSSSSSALNRLRWEGGGRGKDGPNVSFTMRDCAGRRLLGAILPLL